MMLEARFEMEDETDPDFLVQFDDDGVWLGFDGQDGVTLDAEDFEKLRALLNSWSVAQQISKAQGHG